MASGQILNVVVCADVAPGIAAGQLSGPLEFLGCPVGQSAYVVQSYVPLVSSQAFFDAAAVPVDLAWVMSSLAVGFMLVVSLFLVGVGGNVLLKPFFSNSRY